METIWRWRLIIFALLFLEWRQTELNKDLIFFFPPHRGISFSFVNIHCWWESSVFKNLKYFCAYSKVHYLFSYHSSLEPHDLNKLLYSLQIKFFLIGEMFIMAWLQGSRSVYLNREEGKWASHLLLELHFIHMILVNFHMVFPTFICLFNHPLKLPE